jgi:D-amino peptidase
VLVTGDEKAVAQTIEFVGDRCVGVAVKEGYATTSAIHLHPARAQELIRQGAEEAMRRVAEAKPWVMAANCQIEIDFDHQTRADQCLYIPGVERKGVRTIGWTAADALAFIRVWRAVMRASGVALTP